MRKIVSDAPREVRPRRPWRIPWAWLIGGGLLSPYLYELARLCHARWMSMVGPVREVQTPVLDRTVGLVHSAWSGLGSQFESVPWSPNLVVGIGLAWAAGCMWLFRRR